MAGNIYADREPEGGMECGTSGIFRGNAGRGAYEQVFFEGCMLLYNLSQEHGLTCARFTGDKQAFALADKLHSLSCVFIVNEGAHGMMVGITRQCKKNSRGIFFDKYIVKYGQ